MKTTLILATLVIMAANMPSVLGMTLREYELGWARYYAQSDHVPFVLVEAIIVVESGGNPYAVSPKGAGGVMQLMPETAYDFGVRNRFLVQENIRAGTPACCPPSMGRAQISIVLSYRYKECGPCNQLSCLFSIAYADLPAPPEPLVDCRF